tara:strand:+ start:92 stop:841 length:750 start_codon:yes stop_codon:yes gene_type:complete
VKILVIGDSCVDKYIYGSSERLCPDAPVPVFLPSKEIETGGMAKNTHANILSLNIECDIITNSENVVKTRFIDERTNHMFLRLDTNEEKIERIASNKLQDLSRYDAIVISDYNKGFLTKEDIDFICTKNKLVFLDTKKTIGMWAAACTFIKINEQEYINSRLLFSDIDDVFYENLIVTLGKKGATYKAKKYNVKEVDVKDMTGAGDTFLAGLVVEYVKTKNIEESIKFANVCATGVVQKKGVVTINEIE